MKNKEMEELKPEEHQHIWKYFNNGESRVCEAPFPTIYACGKREEYDGFNWIERNGTD